VLDRGVAIRTFDLVVGDMHLVHKLSGIFGRKDLGFTMALNAFPFWDMAIPLNHIDMAPLAFNSSCNILPVVKVPAFDLDIALGFDMAGDTASHCAGDTFFFSFRACPIVMADETVDFMDGEMGSLNDLGMAAGAPKLHPSSKLLKVFPVGESHILVDHILLKILYLMASFLKATCIADLCMRSVGPLAREEISERNLAIHPLPLEMV